jgi:hypothetical protein
MVEPIRQWDFSVIFNIRWEQTKNMQALQGDMVFKASIVGAIERVTWEDIWEPFGIKEFKLPIGLSYGFCVRDWAGRAWTTIEAQHVYGASVQCQQIRLRSKNWYSLLTFRQFHHLVLLESVAKKRKEKQESRIPLRAEGWSQAEDPLRAEDPIIPSRGCIPSSRSSRAKGPIQELISRIPSEPVIHPEPRVQSKNSFQGSHSSQWSISSWAEGASRATYHSESWISSE